MAHKTLKKVTDHLDTFGFNTAVAAMMEFLNEITKLDLNTLNIDEKLVIKECMELMVLMLTPFAPHATSELWNMLGHEGMAILAPWPKLDEKAIVEETKLVVIQINGKVRGKIEIPVGISEDKVKELGFAEANVKKYIEGKEIKKVIYVEGKLLSIAVSDS